MGIVIDWSIENYRHRWLPHKLEKTMKTSPTRRVLFKMGIMPIFDAEIVPSYK